MVIELLSAALQDGNYGKMFDGKDENGNLVPIISVISSSPLIRAHFLGEEQTRKKAGEIIRLSVLPRRHRVMITYSRQARRSTTFGFRERIPACR